MALVEDTEAEVASDSLSGTHGCSSCGRPWWHHVSIQHHRSTPVTSPRQVRCDHNALDPAGTPFPAFATLKTLLKTKRRLRFEPSNKLYFAYEPGKQSTSAVRIKNASHSSVAFKFQTTAPKSCFMRPPNGVLRAGESIVATVVKFIELPKCVEQNAERPQKKKTRDKFKIVSLKVNEGVEFMPEWFNEHKELVVVEQILQVVLLDPNQPTQQLHKLKGLIAEADAAEDTRKQSVQEDPPPVANINEVNVFEEWKQQKLARQKAR